jgi:phage replication-related protein YjqB (UPF0714/DUF867 family)
MAFHGGDLEVGTDLIADAVAARTGASLYAVRQPDGMQRHVPSTRFRPEHSERLAAFVDHVELAVTLHGYGRRGMFRTVLVGGGNRDAAAVVAGELRAHLPAYEVIDELDDIPTELRGLHPSNPVNLPRAQGVQVELPPRVRGNGPFWACWDGGFPTPHTERLVDGLAVAVAALDAGGQGARRSRTQPSPSRR